MPSTSRPLIWMSMVRSRALARLCQLVGTNPRLANSSRTRGMTPGSASAWTEKQAVGSVLARVALAAMDDMVEFLDLGRQANGESPAPGKGDRGANSPEGPGIEAPVVHRCDANRRRHARQ